jgi:hypothetical protein
MRNIPTLAHRDAVRRGHPLHQESLRGLARLYGVNPNTVAKWKARISVADLLTTRRRT